jgi:hypothetical protein
VLFKHGNSNSKVNLYKKTANKAYLKEIKRQSPNSGRYKKGSVSKAKNF